MKAWRGSTCGRCDDLISIGDEVALWHGDVVHAGCAPGGDDEC